MFRLLTCSLCAAACFGAVNYTYTTLGPSPGYSNAIPTSLNNAGQVVGYEENSNPHEQTLVIWNASVPSIVPMPAGFALAVPSETAFLTSPQTPATNASGQILAHAVDTATGAGVGILFNSGTPAVIGAAPNSCGAASTAVFGLNASGHVVGATSGPSCKVFWVWANGTFETFQPPDPAHFVVAGLDDASRVMGIVCRNIPINEGCETGPILLLESGQPPVEYQDGANGISRPNNTGQVTGYMLAGPGSDSIFWIGPTSPIGIPPSGPLAFESCCYTNPNNAGYVVFSKPGGGPYAIMHEGAVVAEIAGNFSTNGAPFLLNDALQFVAGGNLFSPAPSGSARDVTSQIEVFKGEAVLDLSTGRFRQQVTLTNRGQSLPGKVSLLLGQLSPRVALCGLSGASLQSALSGAPFLDLPAAFGPAGSQVTVSLEFIDGAHAGVDWVARVLETAVMH